MAEFVRWFLNEHDVEGLTPVKARDLIMRCFYEAQKETYARSRQSLGLTTSDDAIAQSILATLKLVFKEVDAVYEQPSAQDLMKVVEVLARKAMAWGTPEDVIQHHKLQIEKVFRILFAQR